MNKYISLSFTGLEDTLGEFFLSGWGEWCIFPSAGSNPAPEGCLSISTLLPHELS